MIRVRPRQKLGILSPAKPATVNLTVENDTQTNASGMVPTFDLNRLQQDPSAPEEERKAIRRLVAANADVFSLSDDQMGCTGLLKHRIILTTDTPTSLLYRRIPPSTLQEVRDHLDSLLSQDVITPSSSPYAAPIVLARKKSGPANYECVVITAGSMRSQGEMHTRFPAWRSVSMHSRGPSTSPRLTWPRVIIKWRWRQRTGRRRLS